MHIEPGAVDGAKLLLGYATGSAAIAYAAKIGLSFARATGLAALAQRSAATTALVFVFFQVLPHPPVGVSEVHLILGSTLFLLFGLAPTALGLTIGLLLQGLLFAPFDLPQYGMNVTTLLVPLFALAGVAERMIPTGTRYVDIGYRQVFALSATYQAGIVGWVVFWTIWGHGLSLATAGSLATFGAAYLMVLVIEPLIDLAVLAGAKAIDQARANSLFEQRLFQAL
ncbi:energy-coupling factor ABC transporter permease [Acuticoccus sediminis]|uniref:energy-coupling factor ABC transporter permease n=1 Tax=Acuticoccus sediminis TaxID=2184697 RepID=UPI001CFDD864|nr:energy-coupling factor ABC transporter permease [Acuticoccus sediminis]